MSEHNYSSNDSTPTSPTSSISLSRNSSFSHTSDSADGPLGAQWIGDDMSPVPSEGVTRVGTWNVHGGLSAISISGYNSKLDSIINYMTTFHIDILCITEPGCSSHSVRLSIPKGFAVFGYTQKASVMWITTSKWAPYVRLSGLDATGRISVLYLSGLQSSRCALIGFYGFTTAGINREALSKQEDLLRVVERLVDRSLTRNREVIWMGDINMILRSQDCASALQDSIERFNRTMDSLGLVSAFIYSHPHISLQDGAYTRHSGGTGSSLIDHISLDPHNIVQCGILISDSVATDHRLLVSDVLISVVSSSHNMLPSPDLILDTWSNYDLDKLRSWQSDSLALLETQMSAAVHSRDTSHINSFWSDIKSIMGDMHKDCQLKSSSQTYRDHEASRLARMLTRWKHVTQEVRRLLPHIGISQDDIRGRLYVMMWGGRSYYSIRSRWTKHNADTWKQLQLPRKNVMPLLAGLSPEDLRYRDIQVTRWYAWLERVTLIRSQLLKHVKRRSNKWRRFIMSENSRHKLQDASGGHTSKLFRQVFPEPHHCEPTSIQIGSDWITDPLAVANEIGRAMRALSPSDEWTRPYQPDSRVIRSGPWIGCDRMPPKLQEIIDSGRCEHIHDSLLGTLQPVDMSSWLSQLASKKPSSAPGVSGLGYGMLRSMPVNFQYVALHLRNLIGIGQVLPTGLADLLITAIPKPQASVSGYGGFRPISRYETLLKLATGSIHSQVSEVLRNSRIMHPNQFFAVRYSGVVDALQLVLHAMELHLRSGGRLVIKSADVASAFPSVQHWYMAMVMKGYRFPDALVRFFLLADEGGKFSMRTKQSFSNWFEKPSGGIGQGEQGSPSKYALIVDPLLWLLQEYKHRGLYVGDHFSNHLATIHPDLQAVVIDGFLVAIMFCDDLFMISSCEEDMQELIHVVTGFHDLQGSRLVAHKSYYGASTDRPPLMMDISSHLVGSAKLIGTVRSWFADHVRTLAADSIITTTSGIRVKLRIADLPFIGEPSLRLHCSLGTHCPNYTPHGCLGRSSPSTHTLLNELLLLSPHIVVQILHQPLYVLDVRSGAKHYIRWVKPNDSFRVLGLQLSPSLDWTNARTILHKRLTTLQGMLNGAARRREWGIANLMLAQDGKIMNKLRFDASLVPVTQKQLQQWTQLQGRIFSHAIRLPLGVSPKLIMHHSDLGIRLTRFWNVVLQACVSSQVMALESEGLLGLFSRANLRHYQHYHGFAVCPLALPLHPLEPVSSLDCDARWTSLRMLCTQARISIDTSSDIHDHLLAPWQAVLPLVPRDRTTSASVLRTHLSKVTNFDTKKMSQLYAGKIMGVVSKAHTPQSAYTLLHRWIPILHWPRWQSLQKVEFWTSRTLPLDSPLEGDANLCVSDATVRSDGSSGFCCAGFGLDDFLLGRCNFNASSGDAELCGIIANIERLIVARSSEMIIGCDNIGSLFKALQRIRSPIPSSRLSLKRMAPLWQYLQLTFHDVVLNTRLSGLHIKAHVSTDTIEPNTPTWLQDWCDRSAPLSIDIAASTGDFFTHDMKFGVFDVTSGYLPGTRERITSALPQLLRDRAVIEDTSDDNLAHIDGSFSWRAVSRIKWLPMARILHPGTMTGLHSFYWQQSYSFKEGVLNTLRMNAAPVKDMYGLFQRIKLMIVSGRTWSNTSILSDEQIDEGMGICTFCNTPALDSVSHVLECKGDKHHSVALRMQFLHLLHFCQQLSSLYCHHTHGMISSNEDTLPAVFRQEHHNSASASVTNADEFYRLEASTHSDILHHGMLQRVYRVRRRRYEFISRLADVLSSDPDFRAPLMYASSLDKLSTGALRAPDPPESAGFSRSRSARSSDRSSQISLLGPHHVLTYRLSSIWHSMRMSTSDFIQLIQSSIERNKCKLHGSLLSPLFQEALARWIGIDKCSVLTLFWYHIWDIPLTQVGLHTRGLSEQDVQSIWNTTSNWLCGILQSPADLAKLMRLLGKSSLTRGLAIVRDSPLLQHVPLHTGWRLSHSFDIEIQPFLGQTVQKTVSIRVRIATFRIHEKLPDWIFTWSSYRDVFTSTDRMAQSKSELITSLTSLDWETRSWHTHSSHSPLKQGMQAGLLPVAQAKLWRSMGLSNRTIRSLHKEFFYRQMELWHGLTRIRHDMHRGNQPVLPISSEIPGSSQGIAFWSSNASDATGLDATAFDSQSQPSVINTSICNRRSLAPIRRIAKNKDFISLCTEDELQSCVACACGNAISWISTGADTKLGTDATQPQQDANLCGTCRSLNCPKHATGACLHCDTCGHCLSIQDICYTPSATVVCRGCADWFSSRWRHHSLWKQSTRQSAVMDMILRASKWWSMDTLSFAYAQRIASGLINDWPTALPIRTNKIISWGWLWCIMQPILLTLNLFPRTHSGPQGCKDSSTWIPMHMPTENAQQWLSRCKWSLFPSLSQVDSFSLPESWIQLWNHYKRKDRPTGLILAQFDYVEDCCSDVSSVEGGEFSDDDDKCCQARSCPFDVTEDHGSKRTGTVRHLFLCNGCNNGYHQECVDRLVASDGMWKPIQSEVDWFCATCLQQGNGIMSYAIDAGLSRTGAWQILIKWSSSSATDITIEPLSKLQRQSGAAQVISSLNLRLDRRKLAGQDRHGKLCQLASHPLVYRTDICHPDTLGFNPTQNDYKRRTARCTGFPDYGTWCLTHPAMRQPLPLSIVTAWSPPQASRTRSASEVQRWNSFYQHWLLTLTARWYLSSEDRMDLPCIGSTYVSFVDSISSEHAWLPGHNAKDVYTYVGVTSSSILAADRHHAVETQCAEIVDSLAWTHQKLTHLAAQLELLPTTHTSVVLIGDARKQRKISHRIDMQTTLRNHDVLHMYESA